MAKCQKCGKRGLFLKLVGGICQDCQTKIDQEIAEMLAKKKEKEEEEKILKLQKNFYVPKDEKLGWELKYQYDDVKIALPNMNFFVKYFKKNINTRTLYACMLQDKKNEYDPKAIKIAKLINVDTGYETLGYLYKGKIQDMANDWISRNDEYEIVISRVDMPKKEIYVSISFYTKIDENSLILYKKSASLIKTTLRGDFVNRQMNILDMEEGEFVGIEEDIGSDNLSYLVIDEQKNELGNLSAKLSENMEKDGYSYIGKVIEIIQKDNGNVGMKIAIYRYKDDNEDL